MVAEGERLLLGGAVGDGWWWLMVKHCCGEARLMVWILGDVDGSIG
jgi:hypothetical protein